MQSVPQEILKKTKINRQQTNGSVSDSFTIYMYQFSNFKLCSDGRWLHLSNEPQVRWWETDQNLPRHCIYHVNLSSRPLTSYVSRKPPRPVSKCKTYVREMKHKFSHEDNCFFHILLCAHTGRVIGLSSFALCNMRHSLPSLFFAVLRELTLTSTTTISCRLYS